MNPIVIATFCRGYSEARFDPMKVQHKGKQIVARREALLRQCDALEVQLRQTCTLGARLLDSTFDHHLLAV